MNNEIPWKDCGYNNVAKTARKLGNRILKHQRVKYQDLGINFFQHALNFNHILDFFIYKILE